MNSNRHLAWVVASMFVMLVANGPARDHTTRHVAGDGAQVAATSGQPARIITCPCPRSSSLLPIGTVTSTVPKRILRCSTISISSPITPNAIPHVSSRLGCLRKQADTFGISFKQDSP